MNVRSILLSGTGLILALGAAPGAAAQDAPPRANAEVDAAGDKAGETEILVTGSRISQPGLISASPISTVTAGELQAAGSSTLETALNRLPQVVGAFNASSQVNPRGGSSTLDLRALGANRTLLLIDGHRIVPSEADGGADVNVVPLGLLKRVDIVTGGASATYGSDAVAGVVNFILDKEFTGIKIAGQYGISDEGDAANQRVELTAGTEFADGRGHISGTFAYANRDFMATSARPITSNSRLIGNLVNGPVTADAANLPSQAIVNAVFANYGVAPGQVAQSAGLAINDDGSLFAPVGAINYRPGGASAGVPQRDIGGTVFFVRGDYEPLISPLEIYQGYARIDYDLSPNVNIYATGLYTRYTNQTRTTPISRSFSVPLANPFIPADLRTILASRATNPNANVSINRTMADLGPQGGDNRNETFQFIFGVSGDDIFKDWSWDASYVYGQVNQRRIYTGGFSPARANTLLTAADGGRSLCDGGFNVFAYTPLSAGCIDYLTPVKSVTNRLKTVQGVFEANLSGTLFALPAGDLKFASGIGYRHDKADFDADPNIATPQYAGYVAADGGASYGGKQIVKEIYGELRVPILKDLPLVQSLTANVGYRYSDYNSIGGVSTYKAMVEWKVADPLLIRGGYQRAIRAPSIGELYGPRGIGGFQTIGLPTTAGLGDPCDIRSSYRNGASAAQVRSLCLAQGVPQAVIDSFTYGSSTVSSDTEGNVNLSEETANSYSVGAVFTPKLGTPLLSGLTVSVDYWGIEVKDAIRSIVPTIVLSSCFNNNGANSNFSANSPFCQVINRDPATGSIASIPQSRQNLGVLKTAGVDVTVNFQIELDDMIGANAGRFDFNLTGTRLTEYAVSNFPGDPIVDYLGTIGGTQDSNHPKWRHSATLTYENGPASLSLQWRYFSKMADVATVGNPTSDAIGVPAYNYFDLTGRVEIGDNFELRAGVVNMFDKDPPVYTSFRFFNTDPLNYDIYGRRFFVGASAKF